MWNYISVKPVLGLHVKGLVVEVNRLQPVSLPSRNVLRTRLCAAGHSWQIKRLEYFFLCSTQQRSDDSVGSKTGYIGPLLIRSILEMVYRSVYPVIYLSTRFSYSRRVSKHDRKTSTNLHGGRCKKRQQKDPSRFSISFFGRCIFKSMARPPVWLHKTWNRARGPQDQTSFDRPA